MSYEFKTKDAPKSIAFEITRNQKYEFALKKGSKIIYRGEERIVESIRSVSFENSLIKITGKCR